MTGDNVDPKVLLAALAALEERGEKIPEIIVLDNTGPALNFDPRELMDPKYEPARLPGYQPPKQKKRKRKRKVRRRLWPA